MMQPNAFRHVILSLLKKMQAKITTVKNITVSKVYEANSFADYSGAHIDIGTKEQTGEDFFSLSFNTPPQPGGAVRGGPNREYIQPHDGTAQE